MSIYFPQIPWVKFFNGAATAGGTSKGVRVCYWGSNFSERLGFKDVSWIYEMPFPGIRVLLLALFLLWILSTMPDSAKRWLENFDSAWDI